MESVWCGVIERSGARETDRERGRQRKGRITMATPGSSPSPPPPESRAVQAFDAQFAAIAKSHRPVRCIVKLGEFVWPANASGMYVFKFWLGSVLKGCWSWE